MNPRPGCPVVQGNRVQDPEQILARWIAAAAAVESLAFDLAGQVPQARVLRILLLSQDMERLVQDLQAALRAPQKKRFPPGAGDSQRASSPLAFAPREHGQSCPGGVKWFWAFLPPICGGSVAAGASALRRLRGILIWARCSSSAFCARNPFPNPIFFTVFASISKPMRAS